MIDPDSMSKTFLPFTQILKVADAFSTQKVDIEFLKFPIETGDRLGSSWFSISCDRLENSVSLGHTYCYPQSPWIMYLGVMPLATV